MKWDRETLLALHRAEIEEAKKYNPDLSLFNVCTEHYDYLTHLERMKAACGVAPEFNQAEEKVMKKVVERVAYLNSKSPFTLKHTSFRDLTL